MSIYRTIARASAALSAAALLGAGAAAAQPLDGSGDGQQWQPALTTRSEALNAQHGLGERPSPGSEADPFAACRTVWAPLSRERFLCFRSAANLANELRVLPRPPTRPIVMESAGLDWPDAGVGFGAAAGLALLGAGSAVALRSLGG